MADNQDQPFERHLGRFVMNFGALEYLVLVAIAELAKDDADVKPTDHVERDFVQRVGHFDRLARKRIGDPSVGTEQAGLVAAIKALARTRNEYVHGAWFDLSNVPLDAMKGKVVRREGKLTVHDLYEKFSGHGVTPQQIANAANETNRVIQRFKLHLETLLTKKPAVVKDDTTLPIAGAAPATPTRP
jgi:hypothetical protein